MKISKYFMVAAASIMMFGCAKNDENKPSLADEGPVALTINIADPQLGSKAPIDPSTGTTVELEYDAIEVNLTAEQNGTNGWLSIPVASLVEVEGTPSYTFYNVVKPTKIEVRINATDDTDYEDLEIYKVPAKDIPVYGSSSTFTPTGETAEDTDGNLYNLYETEVNVTIPVARLEFSGITHEAHDGGVDDNCMYTSIQFNGIDILENATDEAPLVSETFESPLDFMTGVYPTGGQCYALSIEPGMPTVRFNFTTNDGPRYAVVKEFKMSDGSSIIQQFAAGTIYQVESMVITDENLTPDPTGNTAVAVEVTVSVQNWNVVSGVTVEFK